MGSFMSTISSMVSKIGFWGKQHAPEILTVTGITLGVGATVTACVATVKAVEAISDAKEKVEALEKDEKDGEFAEEKKAIKRRTVGKVAAFYGPAFGLTLASAGCTLYGMKIIKNEKTALAMAFAGLASDFKGYRERTRELLGDAAENEIRYGLKSGEIVETVEDENGKTKKTKTKAALIDPDQEVADPNSYVRVFCNSNPRWNECLEYDRQFLRSQQWVFNEMLAAKGHVYLNDVLYALGFPQTKAGHEVGWVADPEDPTADNYIDFRVTETKIPITVMVNDDGKITEEIIGYKDGFLLDFNVDGSITDKVDWMY